MIDIFALRLPSYLQKETFDRLLKCVDSEKQDKVKRFIRYEDAQRALYADLLIRRIICEKLEIENHNIIFDKNSYGKPFLKNYQDFHFNLSHSKDWIVCAVGSNPVGIDVEVVKPMEMDIARRFFSAEEYAGIVSKDERERVSHFFELWTLKESYIKAWGKGLSIPLDSFTMRINGHTIEIETENEFNNCFFRQYHIDPGYKMAVCSVKDDFPDEVVIVKSEELHHFFSVV